MQKVIKKESLKLLKLCIVGFLLIIVLVLAGEKLTFIEAVILGITPYILYQIYCATQWLKRRKKR
jgi:asparagine N-glycosylation enzyme membrane subunit Stt3